MSPSRLGEDGIPMTCLEGGFLPWWIQNFDRGNGPSLRSMLNTSLPGPPVLRSVGTIIERKMASHIMMLWKYKRLN
jgi:hypothetical protein